MKRRGIILLMNDAPADKAFVDWLQGPHMEESRSAPGVTNITRYKIVDGPPERRQYLGIIESDDLDATLAWRNGPQGQRAAEETLKRGLRNRTTPLVCEPVFSTEKDKT
jgi:hypothetical protein